MNGQRKAMLWLMIGLGAFAACMAGALISFHFYEEREGVLRSNAIAQLKEKLVAKPKDDSVKEEIRIRDLQLRQEHFQNRERFRFGAYFVLAAFVGFIASARRFFALGKEPAPEILTAGATPERRAKGIAAVSVVGLMLILGLNIVAMSDGPDLPEYSPALSEATQITEAKTAETPVVEDVAFSLDEYMKNWPCFRGPDNLGLAGEGDWPVTWSVPENQNIVWAQDVPSEGKSSPVVWGDRIFLSGSDEETHHVMCFGRADGKLLWDSEIDAPRPDEPPDVLEDTGFAAPTAASDGQRVFAVFATGMLVALDFDGNLVWSEDLGPVESMYGFAASLICHESTVIVQLDQGFDPEEELSELIGFNSATGEELYAVPRPVGNSWTSPSLIRADERIELVTCADPWVIAYDPATGEELWRAEGLSGDVAPSPAYGGGLIFATQDYAQLMAIRPGGSGNVTETHVAWISEDGMPDTTSPVTDGTRLLQIDSGGDMTCFDAQTGEMVWDDYLDSPATPSPILAGGLVYIVCNDGVSIVMDWTESFDIKSTNETGVEVCATPAFVDSRIYLRSEHKLYCIGKTE